MIIMGLTEEDLHLRRIIQVFFPASINNNNQKNPLYNRLAIKSVAGKLHLPIGFINSIKFFVSEIEYLFA